MTDTADSGFDSRLTSPLERHPIAGFLVLAVAGSWAVWIPTFLLLPDATSVAMVPGAFAPMLAAAAMIQVTGGSVRTWLTEGMHWRVDSRWYAVTLTLPILFGLALACWVSLRTGTFDTSNAARTVLVYPISVLVLAIAGGGQEEFGWRGYALPALQERWSALSASVAIGVVWAVWHLPAFVFEISGYTGSFVLYSLLVVGVSVVFTWLYNNTDGSILLAMLLHGGVNASSGLGALFVEAPSMVTVSPYVVLVPLVWAAAGVLIAWYGHETLADGPRVTRICERIGADQTEVSE